MRGPRPRCVVGDRPRVGHGRAAAVDPTRRGAGARRAVHDRPHARGLDQDPSALRTTESQQNLRKVNRQATRGPSAHWHGTTFDLGYRPEHWRPADAPGHAWLARNRRVAYLYRKAGALGAPARAATKNDTCIKTAMRTVLRDELVRMRTEGLLWALEESGGAFHVTVRQGVSRSAGAR